LALEEPIEPVEMEHNERVVEQRVVAARGESAGYDAGIETAPAGHAPLRASWEHSIMTIVRP
jgi:hypothetical protein